MQAPTNGFFYVLDRETGKLISAGEDRQGHLGRAHRPGDRPAGRRTRTSATRTGSTEIWPGTVGAHNWQAMSYSPRTGLVYIPYMQIGRALHATARRDAFVVVGLTPEPIDQGRQATARARCSPGIRSRRRRAGASSTTTCGTAARWRPRATSCSRARPTAGSSAYDARDGKRLWRFNAGLGIIAAPMSYSRERQAICLGAGRLWRHHGGLGDFMNVGWKYGAQPRRLLTFALDGKATLPADRAARHDTSMRSTIPRWCSTRRTYGPARRTSSVASPATGSAAVDGHAGAGPARIGDRAAARHLLAVRARWRVDGRAACPASRC